MCRKIHFPTYFLDICYDKWEIIPSVQGRGGVERGTLQTERRESDVYAANFIKTLRTNVFLNRHTKVPSVILYYLVVKT